MTRIAMGAATNAAERIGRSGAGVDGFGRGEDAARRRSTLGRLAAFGAVVAAALVASPGVGAAQEAQALPPTAGYDGGFFLRSADGSSLFRLNLVTQLRHVRDWRPEDAIAENETDEIGGFQFRRLQVDIRGNVRGPRWNYRLRIDASNGGGFSAAWAYVGYQFSNATSVRVGQFKPAFLHEENISATSQLTPERSYTADYFTTDFSQGVQAIWQRGRARLTGTIHSGSYGYRTDFQSESTGFAVAGRGEFVLFASDPATGWRRYNDFQSWAGAGPAVIVGVAGDYELGEVFGAADRPDVVKWTGDVVAKAGPLAAFGAVIVQRFDANEAADPLAAALDGATQLGLVGQAAVFVLPDRLDLFGRYERIDFDGVYFRWNQGAVQSGSRPLDEDRLSILTVGGNYYVSGHNAKITVAAIVTGDAVPVANTAQGLLRASAGSQWALQSQLQFTF